jgi:D-serine deaminase-like pyridoxal phosphate-dependent protein
MPQAPPARVGDPVDAIDTPALVLDLETFERNLARMTDAVRGTRVRLRPHGKAHKCAEIALRQTALGAVGICAQKVSEAEAFVDAGVRDVFVSNEVVGANKIERLVQLARRARIGVCVDDAQSVRALGGMAQWVNTSLDVFVEIDVGQHRCGVAPGAAALALARAVDAQPALRFAGLQAYLGSAQHVRSVSERRQSIAAAAALARQTRELIVAAGLTCDVVTGGGTGTFPFEIASGVYDEIQPGSYVFMDADYSRNEWRAADGEVMPQFEQSLFLLATVMSRPVPARAVVDAGLKATSVESGLPRVVGCPGVEYVQPSDEHGVLAVDSDAPGLRLGEKLRLVPGHCDPTVNLHDWIVGVRGDRVECVWAVTARGAIG